MDKPLIVVSYALHPGPGGAEAYVNKHFLLDLYRSGKRNVYVIHGNLVNPNWTDECKEWTWIPNQPKGSSTVNGLQQSKFKILKRIVNKLVFMRFGYGLKMRVFEKNATAQLEMLLQKVKNPVVYSRVLPIQSLNAVGALKGTYNFKWFANINDPIPPDIWKSTYSYNAKAVLKWRKQLRTWFRKIDGFTFPTKSLQGLHETEFPQIKEKPSLVMPHHTLFNDAKKSSTTKKRVLYLGSLPKRSQTEVLATGIRKLNETDTTIEWLFLCPMLNPGLEAFVANLGDTAKLKVSRDEKEILKEIGEADGFLFLGFKEDEPLLHTKICTYIKSNKPIIGFADMESESYKTLKQERVNFLSPLDDINTFVQQSEKCFKEHWLGYSEDTKTYFDAKHQLNQLHSFLKLSE